MKTYVKKVNEIKTLNVNFTPYLIRSDRISVDNVSITSTDTSDDSDSTSTIVVSGSEDVSSGTISFRVQAGADREYHKIVVDTGETHLSNRFIETIYLAIVDYETLVVSLQEFKDYAEIDDSSNDAVVLSTLRAANDFIEQYTGRKFSFQTYSKNFYLEESSDDIILENPPIYSIESIVIDGETLSAVDGNYETYTFDAHGRVRRLDGGTFPRGNVKTTITYKGGFQIVPEDVRLAIMRIAASQYTNRLQSGVLGETIGNYKVTFKDTGLSESDNSDVISVLNKYRNRFF